MVTWIAVYVEGVAVVQSHFLAAHALWLGSWSGIVTVTITTNLGIAWCAVTL